MMSQPKISTNLALVFLNLVLGSATLQLFFELLVLLEILVAACSGILVMSSLLLEDWIIFLFVASLAVEPS